MTALMLATKHGNVEVVELLLNANVNYWIEVIFEYFLLFVRDHQLIMLDMYIN